MAYLHKKGPSLNSTIILSGSSDSEDVIIMERKV